MTVKTITCHDVYNAGASLQAYALAAYLRAQGADTQIIDYKPPYLCHYKLWGVGNEDYHRPLLWQAYNLAKLPGRIKARRSEKKKAFDDFTARYLPLTPRRYGSFEELRADPPPADLYIAGSDQIWNPLFQNGRDPAFFLDFAPRGSVRASYAASFATDRLPGEHKRAIAERLTRMDRISVRESSGLDILKDLGITGGVRVPDPVFLLDAAHWQAMTSPPPISEPYLLVYDFDRSPALADFARETAREHGWRILSLFPCDFADEVYSRGGPLAFLSLIYGASFVLSNSFHATAFALLFGRDFALTLREEDINARLLDLLNLFGARGRLLAPGARLTPLDGGRVAETIAAERERGQSYLQSLLKTKP